MNNNNTDPERATINGIKYDVSKLMGLVDQLQLRSCFIHLSDIKGWNWFGTRWDGGKDSEGNGLVGARCRKSGFRQERYEETNTRYPVLVISAPFGTPYYWQTLTLINGRHRICKLVDRRMKRIGNVDGMVLRAINIPDWLLCTCLDSDQKHVDINMYGVNYRGSDSWSKFRAEQFLQQQLDKKAKK